MSVIYKFPSQSIPPSTVSVFPLLSLLLTKSSLLLTRHPLNSFPHKSHLPPVTIFTSGTCCLQGQALTYNALFTITTKEKAVVSVPVWVPGSLYTVSLRSSPGAWHRQLKLVEFTAPPWPLPLTLKMLCYLYGTLLFSSNTDRFTSEVFQLERSISIIIIPQTILMQQSSHTKCFS